MKRFFLLFLLCCFFLSCAKTVNNLDKLTTQDRLELKKLLATL